MSRVEEYRRQDGTWSLSRRDAQLITALNLANLLVNIDPVVPLTYYLGTAQHETNWATNERDTEESGFQSWGLFQLSEEEAADVGMPQADLMNPVQTCLVMVHLTNRRRTRIREVAKITGGDPPDLCAYLAIAHNQGLGAAIKSIQNHGLDWAAYRHRNPNARIIPYGDDCLPVRLGA